MRASFREFPFHEVRNGQILAGQTVRAMCFPNFLPKLGQGTQKAPAADVNTLFEIEEVGFAALARPGPYPRGERITRFGRANSLKIAPIPEAALLPENAPPTEAAPFPKTAIHLKVATLPENAPPTENAPFPENAPPTENAPFPETALITETLDLRIVARGAIFDAFFIAFECIELCLCISFHCVLFCLLKAFSLDEVLELLFCVAGGGEPVAEIEVESTRRKLGNLKS